MKDAVKLVSAVALLGSALFSMNADADCRCATGVPIGGNNCGIPNQSTGGWQHIFPMTCSGGSTPSRPSDNYIQYPRLSYEEMQKDINRPLMAVVVDKRNDNIYSQKTTNWLQSGIEEKLKQQYQQAGGDCEIVGYPIATTHCATLYKDPYTFTATRDGQLQKKLSGHYYYSFESWNTQDERATVDAKHNEYGHTILKDVCLK